MRPEPVSQRRCIGHAASYKDFEWIYTGTIVHNDFRKSYRLAVLKLKEPAEP